VPPRARLGRGFTSTAATRAAAGACAFRPGRARPEAALRASGQLHEAAGLPRALNRCNQARVVYTGSVTFVLGWCDDDGAFICADSAVTHDRAPLGATSSFGEAQQVDGLTIEEGAVKILQLPREMIVAVCGDAKAALDFIMSVQNRLKYTGDPLRRILAELSSAADRRFGFELLFGHRVDGVPVLTAFDIKNASIDDVGNERVVALGSLPREKRMLAVQLVTAVRQHNLPAEARLAAALVVLQSMGITEYLPQHRVGGAFFGAYASRDYVVWQPDLDYLMYRPGTFTDATAIRPGDQDMPPTRAIAKVRVLVREGAGILLSSLGSPAARLLIPPTSERSEAEWEAFVLAAVPPPFPLVVPGSHIALLSTCFSKAVYIYNPALRDGAFAMTDRSGLVCIEAAPRLVETIERATPSGSFDLTIVTETEDGTSAKTDRLAIPI